MITSMNLFAILYIIPLYNQIPIDKSNHILVSISNKVNLHNNLSKISKIYI